MFRKLQHILSFLILTVMLCAMMPAAVMLMPATPVSADTWDGTSSNTTWSGSGTENDPYIIDCAAKLKGLADNVNSGTDNFSGVFFNLTDDINLGNHAWTPIGGNYTFSSSIPDTGSNYFAGIFDGDNFDITGISITSATNGNGGYGLFGYINGGTVGNLNIAGTISLSSYSSSDIGGIVGYITGNLYNCHSSITITATNTNTSHVGGIAGIAERVYTGTRPDPNYIRYCSNTGTVTGSKRTGGIVGQVYCHYHDPADDGGVVVDQCFNTGHVTSSSSSKTYCGGIVGYNTGNITNCYNQGDLTGAGSSVKVYLAGMTGINTAESSNYDCALSMMENCYGTGDFSNFRNGYAKFMWASADGSSDVDINRCVWLNTNGSVTQPTDSSYGDCVNCTVVTTDMLKNIIPVTGSTYIVDYLGSANFTMKSGVDYPILTWQGIDDFKVDNLDSTTPSCSGTDTDDPGAIFLDGTAGPGGDGTKANPYNTLASALGALTSANNTIFITGQVTVSGTVNVSSAVADASILRSCSYTGYLFDVVTGGNLTIQDIILDGNSDNVSVISNSPVVVNGGTLTIGDNATLQNNFVNGGALRVVSGNAIMNAGYIEDNTASNYGGGVMVLSNNSTSFGTFTMSGGTISNNAAQTGGGVAVLGNGVFAMTGGTIGNNSACSYNSTGIAVLDTTCTLNLSQSINITDYIYLVNGSYIYFPTAITGNICLRVTDPSSDPKVAEGISPIVTIYSFRRMSYVGGTESFTQVGTEIFID